MTIKKALKVKNRLLKELSSEFYKVSRNNAYYQTKTPPYNAAEALANFMRISDELIDLKTRIHTANLPVFGKIFRLSELKNRVKHLKTLDFDVTYYYDKNLDKPIFQEFSFSVEERDRLIGALENEIDTIQDELDHHNFITSL